MSAVFEFLAEASPQFYLTVGVAVLLSIFVGE